MADPRKWGKDEANRKTAGGYPKFLREGWNENYLPVWLQDAGYNTFYTGKLMNGHSTSTWNAPYANGWTGNDCEPQKPPLPSHEW